MRFLFYFIIYYHYYILSLYKRVLLLRIAQIQYVPTRSSEEISCILNFPSKTRQQRWSKMELLLIMRIDKPKLLVSNRENSHLFINFSNNSILVLHSFMLISSLIVPSSSLHSFNNELYIRVW